MTSKKLDLLTDKRFDRKVDDTVNKRAVSKSDGSVINYFYDKMEKIRGFI